jgi:hypothetical protein
LGERIKFDSEPAWEAERDMREKMNAKENLPK